MFSKDYSDFLHIVYAEYKLGNFKRLKTYIYYLVKCYKLYSPFNALEMVLKTTKKL